MPARRQIPDESSSFKEFFGTELRRHRLVAGLTQEQFGALDGINYSQQMVAAIEGGSRTPTKELAENCDLVFESGGHFLRIWERIRKETLPTWFRPYAELEDTALSIKTFAVQLVPGLLQTEAYARDVLGSVQPPEAIDALLEARMSRQQLLFRENSPQLLVVLDEVLLLRQIGGPAVMRDQLRHILHMSTRMNVIVQIVPINRGSYAGLEGGFSLLSFLQAPDAVYVENSGRGWIIDKPNDVAVFAVRYELIRSTALPAAESRKIISEAMEAM